jgi:hypothetical protein
MRHSLLAAALRLTLATAGALALAPQVHAAEKPVAKAGEGNNLDLAIVGVPIVFHGKLVNYVMVRLRLKLTPGADPHRLQDKEPYFREALVKLGYQTPLNPPTDLTKVDEHLLISKMMLACAPIAGPGTVIGIEVSSQQPQTRFGLPDVSGKPATPRTDASGAY